MKQILSENKIPTYNYEKKVDGKAPAVASEIIQFYFDNAPRKPVDYTYDDSTGNIKFTVDVGSVPADTMKKIWKLRDEIRSFGALTIITDDSITIVPEGEVKDFKKKITEKARISYYSMSGFDQNDDKNSFQQHCEHKAQKKREIELDSMLTQDSIEVLLSRLPKNVKKVCEILVDPPKDFLEEYYPNRKKPCRPKEIHISKYLGISKSEVSKAIELIKKQALALDIG